MQSEPLGHQRPCARNQITLSCRGLVDQFQFLLHSVAQSLKQRQSLVVLIDGADLIHASSGQLVSDWLPEKLPQVSFGGLPLHASGAAFHKCLMCGAPFGSFSHQLFAASLFFQRVSLVLSVSEGSALLGSLKRRKDVIAVPLGPLEPPDRVALIRKDLALYGKKLEESAFNNQVSGAKSGESQDQGGMNTLGGCLEGSG